MATPAWTRSEGKDPKGGLNAKGVASYRRANPGSKLQTAVTTPPSKLKAGSRSGSGAGRDGYMARTTGDGSNGTVDTIVAGGWPKLTRCR